MRFSQNESGKRICCKPWYEYGFTGCTSKIIQIGSQMDSNGQMVSVVDDTYIQDISFCLRDRIDASCIENGCKWDISPSEISSTKPQKMSPEMTLLFEFCDFGVPWFHDNFTERRIWLWNCIAVIWRRVRCVVTFFLRPTCFTGHKSQCMSMGETKQLNYLEMSWTFHLLASLRVFPVLLSYCDTPLGAWIGPHQGIIHPKVLRVGSAKPKS